jgi:protein-tyrosine phosphatase
VNATATIDHTARAVTFSASLNARDLGGLPVEGGGITRRGVAIRTDALLHYSREDEAYLAAIPVTTVIDLRQPFERERDRSALVSNGVYTVHQIELFQTLYDTGWAPVDEWDLREIYLASLDYAGSAFVRAVRALSDSRGATLFHCTAGKDRTGLLAALVLESVGVPRTVVLEDYVLTHERIGPVRERLLDDARARGIDPHEFARLLGADAEVLEDALEHVDRRFGGAATFLLTNGLTETTLAQLRARLVSP